MPGIASAATAIVINHVAQGTRIIRVGAGGIMLSNHAPLVIAEQFSTLAALHPGRIDLGLGRAAAVVRDIDAGRPSGGMTRRLHEFLCAKISAQGPVRPQCRGTRTDKEMNPACGHHERSEWCPRPDLNQHALRQQILSLPRLPFHHWGTGPFC